jgi:hypothetical protein
VESEQATVITIGLLSRWDRLMDPRTRKNITKKIDYFEDSWTTSIETIEGVDTIVLEISHEQNPMLIRNVERDEEGRDSGTRVR